MDKTLLNLLQEIDQLKTVLDEARPLLDKTILNDEIKYYIESQILSVSRIAGRASDLFL